MIRLNNLQKYFNKGRSNQIHVINDISLEFPENGMVALFGPSGCGKTTLLNVIGGLDGFESGNLTIDGQSIKKKTDDLRNEKIGYIFQNYNLSKQETVFENVADALRLCGVKDKDLISERTLAALTVVGMEKYRNRFPDALSGGQQQRVAIARAIVKNPSIILADEPTGNLDEHNTLQVMNLLKELSQTRLVLLVTHEEKLVEYFCDTIIALSDGTVKNITRQEANGNYTSKDRRDIWLGDLEKKTLDSDEVAISYYGDKPTRPLEIKIVSYKGKFYLQAPGLDLHLVDESSETRLKEGSFEESLQMTDGQKTIDLSSLPPLAPTEHRRYGRLFSLKSSLISGFRTHFSSKKKGSRFFRLVLMLFAAISAFIVGRFGTSVKQLIDVKKSYNQNVFYLKYDGTDNFKWLSSMNEDAAVDSYYYTNQIYSYYFSSIPEDKSLRFSPGRLKSFDVSFSGSLETTGVFLDVALADSYTVLAGKVTELSNHDLIISRTCADDLLEISSFGYINSYDDLIGLTTTSSPYLRIAGIVDTKERSFYVSSAALTEVSFSSYHFNVIKASASPFEVAKGKTIFLNAYSTEKSIFGSLPEITIRGHVFDIEETYVNIGGMSYEDYLEHEGLSLLSIEEYFTKMYDQPLSEEELADICDLNYFDYANYYYQYQQGYIDLVFYMEHYYMEYWLAAKGYIPFVAELTDTNRYYAEAYKTETGKYPRKSEVESLIGKYKIYEAMNLLLSNQDLCNQYEEETRYMPYVYDVFILNDEDYADICSCIGLNTYEVADTTNGLGFIVFHSTDSEKTIQWLNQNLSSDQAKNLVSPGDKYKEALDSNQSDILSGFISLAVLLTCVCICFYFIMRSSLMGRVKELGIYRAIGVSKSNIFFRFFVESLEVFALSLFPGFLLSSILLNYWTVGTNVFADIFFYPVWLALLLLVLLILLAVLCGTLPVLLLLRRKPAEILAKYDI